MNVWIHRYQLVPKRRLSATAREGPREGALLRIDGGFADVHPWPELGDLPLDEQLSLLARGELTALTRASLGMAKADGDARKLGRSLFEGVTIPESHWPGIRPPRGFDTVKLKDAAEIPEGVRVRIDFNGRLTPGQYLQIARELPRDRVDFIEDPTPYDPRTWRQLREEGGLPLAYDAPRSGERLPAQAFDVLVHKPAVEVDFPSFDGPVVVTSSMDHPVGQFGAAWVAATHRSSSRCGLFTHVLYEPDPFLERIRADGARLLPPEGTGIGFDDLLENLAWTRLT
jgi:O-succinylbenzoate synthase